MIRQGPIGELTAGTGVVLEVQCSDPGAAARALDPFGSNITVRPGLIAEARPCRRGAQDGARGYRLRTADGQAHEISGEFKNVEDPYHEMGQLFRGLAANTIGTTMPTFPTIQQVIVAYTSKPRPAA